MNKILIIIKREYLNIVKKKSFIISALLTPILLIGLMILPSVLAGVALVTERYIAVIDETGYVLDELKEKQKFFSYVAEIQKKQGLSEETEERLEEEAKKYGMPGGQLGRLLREVSLKVVESFAAIKFHEIDLGEKSLDEEREIQLNRIRKKEIDVLLVIPEDIEKDRLAEYYSRSSGNFDETNLLRQFISEAVVSKRLNKEGMDPIKIKELTARVGLTTNDVTRTGVKKGSFLTNYLAAIIFVMLMFMAVMQTGQQLMRGVIEEKQNRIIEILLSSIKPNQLISGKVIGLGGAGLTLICIWILAALVGLEISGGMGISIDTSVMVYFAVFFVLGYLLYSTFMAILGAVLNSEHEAQQFISVISILLVFPIFFAMIIVKHPNSLLATILTLIPIFTPTMVIFRVSITPVPLFDIIASVVVLLIAIWLMILLTTKIFRVGILMYGKKPSFKEVLKWMKYR